MWIILQGSDLPQDAVSGAAGPEGEVPSVPERVGALQGRGPVEMLSSSSGGGGSGPGANKGGKAAGPPLNRRLPPDGIVGARVKQPVSDPRTGSDGGTAVVLPPAVMRPVAKDGSADADDRFLEGSRALKGSNSRVVVKELEPVKARESSAAASLAEQFRKAVSSAASVGGGRGQTQ